MIKYCNNLDLEKKNIDSRYYLFYQVWKEFTEVKTLDSYQYRLMNVISAINELKSVIEKTLKEYYKTNHNIDICKQELITIIKSDITLKKYYPMIWNRLIHCLGDKTDTKYKQRALLYKLNYCIKIIENDYLKNLLEELEQDIINKNNKEIINKTNNLISLCVYKGWSTIALSNIIDELFKSKEDITKWDTFKNKLLNSAEETYLVIIPLKIRINPMVKGRPEKTKIQIFRECQELGFCIYTNNNKENLIKKYPCLNSIKSNNEYIIFEEKAYDYYSASHIALSKYSEVLNLLSFYNFISAWSLRDINWSIINLSTEEKIKILKPKNLYSTYDYMEGVIKLFTNAKRIISNKGNNLLKTKLKTVYSYANMNKSSYVQDEKFINSWVALESLCRGNVYDNIILNVLETVSAALCIRYIYRLYRNFIEDCRRCKISLEFDVKSKNREDMVKEIIKIFKDENLYNKLLQDCKINDLLYYRCESLHRLITEKKALYDRINYHYTNVYRQLARLYRIRNDIVHAATHNEQILIRYIEHLDDYLLNVVSEIIIQATEKNEYRIEHIFEIIKDQYTTFESISNNTKPKKNDISEDVLQNLFDTGVISLI